MVYRIYMYSHISRIFLPKIHHKVGDLDVYAGEGHGGPPGLQDRPRRRGQDDLLGGARRPGHRGEREVQVSVKALSQVGKINSNCYKIQVTLQRRSPDPRSGLLRHGHVQVHRQKRLWRGYEGDLCLSACGELEAVPIALNHHEQMFICRVEEGLP